MTEQLDLVLEKEREAFDQIFPVVDELVERHALAVRPAYVLRLVLEELFLNLVKYSKHGQRSNQAWLSIGLAAGEIVVTLEDDGPPFDPTSDAPPPNIPSDLDTARPGGVGLHLVRQLSASVHYDRRGDRNHLETRIKRD